jgi:ABC-2 type transport system permease protein
VNALRVALLHWKLGAMYELQYRVNFFLQVFKSGLTLFTGLVAISLVFRYTSDLGGWTRYELLAVLGVHILLGGLVGTFVTPSIYWFLWTVGEGEFDHTLVRPLDAQLLTGVQQMNFWQLVDVVVGVVVIGWAVSGIGATASLLRAVGFVVAAACGMSILSCLWMLLATTAFKWIRVDDAAQLLHGLYGAGRWPVTVYPGWLRLALSAVVPLGFAITVPAEALAARLNGETLGLLVVVTVVLALATRLAWQAGVRRYSGASA